MDLLEKNHRPIICLQEHWLFDFESSILSAVSERHNVFSVSVDMDDPISPIQRPHGEKNSKYFLNLEKANNIKSTIRTVIDENGETVSDSREVLEKIKNFHGDLYSEKPVNLMCNESSKFFNSPNIPTLNNEEMLSCEGLLTLEECFSCAPHF